MKKLIIIFSLITTNLISQNRDSYFSTSIEDGLYHYFDSLGVKQLYTKSDCDCELQSFSDVFINLDKVDNKFIKSDYIDTLLLNDYIHDEDVDYFMSSYIKFLKKKKIIFKDVLITIDIKRSWIRFNIFRLKYKVKYKIIVTYNYNPIEKK
jgi:hypothetical protein